MHQDNQDFDRALDFSADSDSFATDAINDALSEASDASGASKDISMQTTYAQPEQQEKGIEVVEFNLDEELPAYEHGARIRVIGVGGGGCKAIECMAKSDMNSIDLIAINTDVKALGSLKQKAGPCNNLRLMQLGPKTTRGLGAGSMPENGAGAAQESEAEIRKVVKGCDMVFVTVGLGGGTGTGASPLVAQLAKEEGVLTVAVATLPFYSEGKRRWKTAIEGMEKLLKEVDSLILVPNQKLHEMYGQQSVVDGFMHSDQVLVDAVRGISDLIHSPGDYGGVDFADVRTCLLNKGLSVISVGFAKASPKCAQEALAAVLNNRMLEDCDISGAKGILGNIFGNHNLKMNDVQLITDHINSLADEDAITKIGTIANEELEDGIRLVLVASGINIRGLDVDAITQAKTEQERNKAKERSNNGEAAGSHPAAGAAARGALLNRPSRLGNAYGNQPGEEGLRYQPQRETPHQAPQHETPHHKGEETESKPGESYGYGERKRITRVIETTEEPLTSNGDNSEEDLKKPAYLRKPKYTQLGRFARLNPFQD